MNTANLQIEGVLVTLSALVAALRHKGLLTEAEIEAALSGAQATIADDGRRPAEISPANVAAITFPLRYLRHINACSADAPPPCFSAVAAEIGRKKPGIANHLAATESKSEASPDIDPSAT